MLQSIFRYSSLILLCTSTPHEIDSYSKASFIQRYTVIGYPLSEAYRLAYLCHSWSPRSIWKMIFSHEGKMQKLHVHVLVGLLHQQHRCWQIVHVKLVFMCCNCAPFNVRILFWCKKKRSWNMWLQWSMLLQACCHKRSSLLVGSLLAIYSSSYTSYITNNKNTCYERNF